MRSPITTAASQRSLVQQLDATGAPTGEPLEIEDKDDDLSDVTLERSASAGRMLLLARHYDGSASVALFKPDGGAKVFDRKPAGSVYGVAHASGGTFVFAGRTNKGRLYTQRLTGTGRLKAPRVTQARPGTLGLAGLRPGRRCHRLQDARWRGFQLQLRRPEADDRRQADRQGGATGLRL